jgi:hypothetical protein
VLAAFLQTRATYAYNAIGEMLEAPDFGGSPLKVEYDRMGRKTAMQSADTGRKEHHYDRAGNLTAARGESYGCLNDKDTTVSRSKYEQSFSFDKIGNMTLKESAGSGTAGANLDYKFQHSPLQNFIGDSWKRLIGKGDDIPGTFSGDKIRGSKVEPWIAHAREDFPNLESRLLKNEI